MGYSGECASSLRGHASSAWPGRDFVCHLGPRSRNWASRHSTFSRTPAPPEKVSVTSPAGEAVSLTFAEFELLGLLLANANATLPRVQILQAVFGRNAGLYDRSVDVLMSRLKRKLAKAGVTLNIESVRSVGYMLVGQVTRC